MSEISDKHMVLVYAMGALVCMTIFFYIEHLLDRNKPPVEQPEPQPPNRGFDV
jgi:hypothetical protein